MLKLEENVVNVLVLESQQVFRKFVEDLTLECESPRGAFSLWEGMDALSLSQSSCVITDYFSLDVNSRKLSAALSKWLKAEATAPDMFLRTQQMKACLAEWIDALANACDYPLAYEMEPDLSALFKGFSLRFADDSVGSLEHMMVYLRLCQTYLGLENVFLVNAKRFFSHDELEALYRFAAYEKLRLVLIENVEQRDFPELERVYIVDKDGCEIFDDLL